MTFLTWLFGSKMNSVSLSLQENQKEIFVVKKKWEISNENKTFGKCVFATDCSSSVQSPSLVRLFVTPWTAARQASLSITNSWSLLNSCPSNQWCHPAISSSVIRFSSFLQSFPASGYSLMSQFFKDAGSTLTKVFSITGKWNAFWTTLSQVAFYSMGEHVFISTLMMYIFFLILHIKKLKDTVYRKSSINWRIQN